MDKTVYRYNPMRVDTVEDFLNITSVINGDTKDIYFVRAVGEPIKAAEMVSRIDEKMDALMNQGKLKYKRISNLSASVKPEKTHIYTAAAEHWLSGRMLGLQHLVPSEENKPVLQSAFDFVSQQYKKCKPNASASMVKNFTTKLLYWLDETIGEWLNDIHSKTDIKLVADNMVKEQEYLFFLFLTHLGVDVLLLQTRKDVEVSGELLGYSTSIRLGDFGTAILPEYEPRSGSFAGNVASHSVINLQRQRAVREGTDSLKSEAGRGKINLQRPKGYKPGRTNGVRTHSPSGETMSAENGINLHRAGSQPRTGASYETREKTYEELAQLASSVVLIEIFDKDKERVGSGSGIMIGKDGYILTNFHVVARGIFFAVRIEDEDEVYLTNEILKYNNVTDLAVIRIQRTLKPLPVYNGAKELVRGQRVVAIGSPLGLFNSVSDGIISGFRHMDDVDMIQFTAPISHGSSGGAVLNMQGEIIGISTAGFDEGQNINLAVGYESIRLFAGGFLR